MIVFTRYSEDFQTIFYKNVSNKPLDVEIVDLTKSGRNDDLIFIVNY